MNELEYLYLNGMLSLPFQDSYNSWDVTVRITDAKKNIVLFKATHKKTDKILEYNMNDFK